MHPSLLFLLFLLRIPCRLKCIDLNKMNKSSLQSLAIKGGLDTLKKLASWSQFAEDWPSQPTPKHLQVIIQRPTPPVLTRSQRAWTKFFSPPNVEAFRNATLNMVAGVVILYFMVKTLHVTRENNLSRSPTWWTSSPLTLFSYPPWPIFSWSFPACLSLISLSRLMTWSSDDRSQSICQVHSLRHGLWLITTKWLRVSRVHLHLEWCQSDWVILG